MSPSFWSKTSLAVGKPSGSQSVYMVSNSNLYLKTWILSATNTVTYLWRTGSLCSFLPVKYPSWDDYSIPGRQGVCETQLLQLTALTIAPMPVTLKGQGTPGHSGQNAGRREPKGQDWMKLLFFCIKNILKWWNTHFYCKCVVVRAQWQQVELSPLLSLASSGLLWLHPTWFLYHRYSAHSEQGW